MRSSNRRDRLLSLVILPAILFSVAILAYFTFRTTLQLETLRRQSVLESTIGLATEKADRLDKRIITEDNVAIALADPAHLDELADRWLPTAQRETPTIRALVVLNEARTVIAFASRAGGAWSEEESFRRLLVERMHLEMNLGVQPIDELRHLHRDYDRQGYLISYWKREVAGRRYLIVAWHDVARIVKETLPSLYTEAATEGAPQSRVNIVDDDGRLIYGPPLRTGGFTVGVRFPTTLYDWRLQVSPSAGEELAARVQNRKTLDLVFVALSCIVIVVGVATILFSVQKEKRLNALKSDFVANVSHELKTPLALVRMFAEMLQTGRVASDAKRSEYLDIIVGESERLSSLIENVLDFARVERGKGAYELADGHIGDVVARAAEVLKYRAQRDGVTLELIVDDVLPIVRIDERAIHLAVMNLIDNALKYGANTGPGSEVITVSVTRKKDDIAVRVMDRGPGVAPEERERIFERFVRGNSAASDGVKAGARGSGIGLALVRHIADSHGGRTWVEPAGARGSAFVFTVPIAKSHAAIDATARRDSLGSIEGASTPAGEGGAPHA